MANDNYIDLGEFWVDSDGEVFIDIDDPLKGMKDIIRFKKIKELQRKMQKNKNDEGFQSPPDTATGFSKKR
jgi:hypothetical protein